MTQKIWSSLYASALTQANPLELRHSIDAANSAIHQRIDELACESVSDAQEELQAIIVALQGLRAIQTVGAVSLASRHQAGIVIADGGGAS
jgi:hypothetical protein